MFDEIGRGTTKRNSPPVCDSLEDLGGQRTGHFSLQDLLEVVGEVLASGARAAHELSVQAIGDVSHLDHLRHVDSMPHVLHMFKQRDR